MADQNDKFNTVSGESEKIREDVAASSGEENIKKAELRIAREQMTENSARADKSATELAARYEYSSEYRQKLMAQQKRRAAEEKKKRLEAEREAERQRRDARRLEIEKFIADETAESEAREAGSLALLDKINRERNEASKASAPVSSSACEKETNEEPEALNTAVSCDSQAEPLAKETVEGAYGDDDLVLNIGQTVSKNENKIFLSIGEKNTAEKANGKSAGNERKTKKPLLKDDLSRALRVAGIKHQALVALAMQSAEDAGLLDKEQTRYNSELDKIRSRADEYTEISESITLARTGENDALKVSIPAVTFVEQGVPHEEKRTDTDTASAERDISTAQAAKTESAYNSVGIPLAFGGSGRECRTAQRGFTYTPEATKDERASRLCTMADGYPIYDYSMPMPCAPSVSYPLIDEYPQPENNYEAYQPAETDFSDGRYIDYAYQPYERIAESEHADENLSYSDDAVYGAREFATDFVGDDTMLAREEELASAASSDTYRDPRPERLWLDDYRSEYGTLPYEHKTDSVAALNDRAPRAYSNGAQSEGDLDSHHEMHLEHINNYQTESVALYANAELSKRLEKYAKDERLQLKKLAKIEARQKGAVHETNILLIIEKIGVQKEICELSVEALYACVYANSRGKTKRYKKNLISHIDRYNSFADEYETATGKPLEHLSYEMADDIIAGRICVPIPNVYYYGEEDDGRYNLAAADAEHIHRIEEEDRLVEEEYLKFLDAEHDADYTHAENRVYQKKQAERMSAIRKASERDILLVGLRNEYRLASLISERDMMMNFYGTDKRKMAKRGYALEQKINKLKGAANRAIKLERADNSRYYLLPALDPAREKVSKRARRERLDALRMRLDVLLSEREDINERLIALYGGADKKLTAAKTNRKAAAVRRKSAKAMYKRQRSVAEKIERARVSADMKNCAYKLLNKKIAAAATFDECYYKLKHTRPLGRAKRELINNMARAKSEIKSTNREIRYVLKRFRRYELQREANKSWAILLLTLTAVALLGFGAWYFWWDDIVRYFADLASKFRR